MLVLALALAMAIGGFWASTPWKRAQERAACVFHLCVVAAITLALTGIGASSDGLARWLIGVWFAALAAVYVGHAFAVRNWGAPMSQAVLLFGLRRFHGFAGANPLQALTACAPLPAMFAVGWSAARLDESIRLTTPPADLLAAGALLLVAGVVWRAACLAAPSDLLLAIVLGGHGPRAGPPPPEDPSLGPRRQHRRIAPRRRPTVVLFVVDSLRPRNMSAHGYWRDTTPCLRTLLQRGARAVPLAISSCATSESAAWALLSSRRFRHLAVNAPCLHDLLRGAGYTVRFLLSGSHRGWMGMEYLYGADHDLFVDCLVDEEIAAEVAKLPDEPAPRGDFLYFHLMSAHIASGSRPPCTWMPERSRSIFSETEEIDAEAQEQIRNHYDNSVLQADRCIAGLLDILSQKRFLDDAIVVVTGDHGEALAERTPVMIGHGRGLYQESIEIPLIFWDTRETLAEPAFLADQTDIAPTVLAALGIEAPSSWHGASVFASPARRSVHVEHVAHDNGMPPTHMEAILTRLPSGVVFKEMRYRRAAQEVFRGAFCLSTDAAELRDLTGRLEPQVEYELSRLRRHYHAQPTHCPVRPAELSLSGPA